MAVPWTVSSVPAAVWLVVSGGSSPQSGAAAAPRVEAPPSADVLLHYLKSMSLGHPRLLFEDVRKAPGWKDPARRAAAVRALVPAVDRIYMKKDFGDPQACEMDKARAARALAFAWLLTREAKYRGKCLVALTHIGAGRKVELPAYNFCAVADYAFAYDYVAETLSPEQRRQIEAALAREADAIYRALPELDNVWHHVAASLALGVVACLVADYSGRLESGPEDWLRGATTYLLVSNPYQPKEATPSAGYEKLLGRVPMQEHQRRAGLNRTANLGGYDRRGGYRFEWADELVTWCVVYSQVFGRNMLDDFPLARKYVNGRQLWEQMPNGQGSCADIGDGRRWFYTRAVLHLLSEPERQAHLHYLERFPPARFDMHLLGTDVLFALPLLHWNGEPPAWTTFISAAAEHAAFRNSWDVDADWLLFKFSNYYIPRAREYLHHDNLSFQLYSRGDYLLSDGGEVRGRTFGYGPTGAAGHNVVLVDGTGAVKGIRRFVNPAYLRSWMIEPWLELADAEMRISWREHPEKDYAHPIAVTPPVTWRRMILYPQKQYFLVIDSLASDSAHTYEWLFHLSSLNIVPTRRDKSLGRPLDERLLALRGVGRDPLYIPGHVIGQLSVGEREVPWSRDMADRVVFEMGSEEKPHWMSPSVPEGEYPGGAITWRTTAIPTWEIDPYLWYAKGRTVPDSYEKFDPRTRKRVTVPIKKRGVELRIVLSPEPEKLRVERTWGIHNMRSLAYEVDHPVVRFKRRGEGVFSIAALLARYAEVEPQRLAEPIPVEGHGAAMKLSLAGVTDFVAVGNGPVRFANVCTDAGICFLRQSAGRVETFLIVRGRRLLWHNKLLCSLDSEAPHAAFHFANDKVEGHVELPEPTGITVRCHFTPSSLNYEPLPDDWIWVWTDELRRRYKPHQLVFRKESDMITFTCPQGQGRIVLR